MSECTGMALLPAVEVSIAALDLSAEDQDLAAEARRLALIIDQGRALALQHAGPQLLKVLESLGGTSSARAAQRALRCVVCAKSIPAGRRRRAVTCGDDCSERYRQARLRNREHVRRAAYSDIAPEQELAMRKRARKCRICGKYMTGKLGQPNSKHLDHIIPLGVGGTHSHGNVRIVCASCNLRRPKDGSDYYGPVTLWAQGEALAGRVDRRHNRSATWTTCRSGLHPWTPGNIVTEGGRKTCGPCRRERERNRYAASRKRCECGEMFSAPGNTLMCPACTDTAARRAADLHARGGLSWKQVAAEVGYGSGEGARYAARRIGYEPERKPSAPKAERPCQCGAASWRHGRCGDCLRLAAQRAVHLRTEEGWTLRMIADLLGYSSITTVTNLMKTVIEIEPRMGRPSTARFRESPTSIKGQA